MINTCKTACLTSLLRNSFLQRCPVAVYLSGMLLWKLSMQQVMLTSFSHLKRISESTRCAVCGAIIADVLPHLAHYHYVTNRTKIEKNGWKKSDKVFWLQFWRKLLASPGKLQKYWCFDNIITKAIPIAFKTVWGAFIIVLKIIGILQEIVHACW